MAKQYYHWIDLMKVVGIYFIILGHLFPLYHEYIYVFSVPLFFVISGFLEKTGTTSKDFYKKIWSNMLVPMILMTFIVWIPKIIKLYISNCWDFNFLYTMIKHILIGEQGFYSEWGLNACWFIYTLVVIKIINRYINKLPLQLLLVVVGLVIAIILDIKNIQVSNSIVNTCVSYPFFLIGVYLNKHKLYLKIGENKKSLLIFLFLIGIFGIFIIEKYNGAPWMYLNEYGNNVFLFLIGGVAGIVAIYAICLLININNNLIKTLSLGTIIILGFHQILISIIKNAKLYFDWLTLVPEYLYAIFILLLLYPFILLCKKYFPIFLGQRKIN